MARVLLMVPPLWPNELFVRGSRSSATLNPPLGLASIAGYLEKHGHECAILDGIAQPCPLEEAAQRAEAYDVVGITALSTYAMRVRELVEVLKRSPKCPPVVVGGAHATVLPETLLEAGADVAVIGEGEATMAELVEALAAGGKDLGNIKGIVYRENGEYVRTPRRPMIDPLDDVPPAARHLLPMHLYSTSVARASRHPSHSMLASRGCPGKCSFCDRRTFGGKIRTFSPDRVVEEFFLLRDKYGARDVALWDDNFVSCTDTALEVCDRLRSGNLDLTWSAEARIDAIEAEVLKPMSDAGCTFIALGIESGSQRMLDHMRKGITKEEIREAVRLSKEAGLAIRGYFMFGFPTETLDEMKETLQFALELDVEVATFTLFLPLPGTLEYGRALETGTFLDPEYYLHRIIPEFNLPDQAHYVPEGLTASALLDFHRRAYNRYYMRPGILVRKLLSVRSPAQFMMLARGGMTIVKNSLSRC